MSPTFNFLLRLRLAYGLHDREAFIGAFVRTFGDRFSTPENAESTGEFLLSQIQALKDELDMSRLAGIFTQKENAGDEKLTNAINDLTKQLAELQKTIEKGSL